VVVLSGKISQPAEFQFIIPWPPGGAEPLNAQTIQPGFEKAIGEVQIVNNPEGVGQSPGITLPFSAMGYTVGVLPSFIITRYTIGLG